MTPPNAIPTLAQRYLELRTLGWPESTLKLMQGRELRYGFKIAPTAMSRDYRCLLKVHVARAPELFVLDPSPKVLAGGRPVPHTYPSEVQSTKLCLWLPKACEWGSLLRLDETYLPWTAEWLDYFEEWLATGEWTGGGVHLEDTPRRWARSTARRPIR